MTVIIEGPDGGGKTTLKDKLLTDIPHLHQVPRHSESLQGPVEDMKKRVEYELWDDEGQICKHCLFDRHALISEPIYGPTCRGKVFDGMANEDWFITSWSLLTTLKPIIIFCLPNLATVRYNIVRNPKEQMAGVIGNIEAIYYGYLFLYYRLIAEGHRAYKWDYTDIAAPQRYSLMKMAIEDK